MTCFISGGAKSGKSSLAQELAVALSGGGKRYYVATMLSTGPEDDERIRRHVADRAGLGFETLECSARLPDCLERADREGTFLVDSVTALLQNALFPAERDYAIDADAARRCCRELLAFIASVGHAVIVSDYIYADAETYTPETETYRRCLAHLDRQLAAACDTVVEVSVGQRIVHKGVLPL